MEFDKIRLEKDNYPVINSFKITGAGVAITEKIQYTLNEEIFDDIVILIARDGDTNIFSIFGGALDIGQSIKSTAIEELQQESLNMFNFNECDLNNCPLLQLMVLY